MSFSLDFPRAYGPLTATAIFRQLPEDFQVDETLGYEPSGEGEHVFLHVKKRGENTAWVAGKIAELAGVKEMDIGYGGRKDRHAVTTQWFSVYLPGANTEPDWLLLNSDTIQVLQVARHSHKLRRGDHQANRFVIRLRDVQTDRPDELLQKVNTLLREGVPNYFGEQRFGRNANNLDSVDALLVERKPIRDRARKGLVLSAARSWLFNQILAARVTSQNWNKPLAGEPESQPSGALWGRGRLTSTEDTLLIEQQALEDWQPWCHGLEHQGLKQERRTLVLKPEAGSVRWFEGDLELSFTLTAGEFATSVLAEVATLLSAENIAAPEPLQA